MAGLGASITPGADVARTTAPAATPPPRTPCHPLRDVTDASHKIWINTLNKIHFTCGKFLLNVSTARRMLKRKGAG